MVVVNCPLKQDDIIKIVENIEIESKKEFKFIKKQGIKIYFESNYSDMEKACLIIKKEIKESELGKVLYFNVVEE
ncbi:hypothetical protein [Clostridium saccharoperbutylacetonicum]|uniref:hypothetical protein n=1 Tax=Clostridium saccharoperbutylacetonicum TaxID=36745 RepID=UPI000983EB32|nr:hypothetical protein [Clostridium saccharoperbutylacetonicum]AQR93160.1 hypothetical protein CLSAP_04370 [Clostridium saccharoperbutylacetonicum]NSB34577.1 hypothetical protein [Clostridium saccharoperbutylacetonicum]